MSSVVCGMPFFLEDSTGDLSGAEYVDLYGRTSLSLRCTLRSDSHTAYMIYDVASPGGCRGLLVPLACLDFGAGHSLGTVKLGDRPPVNMGDYLTKVSPLSSRNRKFKGSDGQEYRWSWRSGKDDAEWTCVNASGYHVASYTLKADGESGCVLNIEESYAHLVGELLATLTIMRHIVKYNV